MLLQTRDGHIRRLFSLNVNLIYLLGSLLLLGTSGHGIIGWLWHICPLGRKFELSGWLLILVVTTTASTAFALVCLGRRVLS